MTKLSININDETAAFLNETKEKKNINVTEQIRRAVSLYQYLHDAQEAGEEIHTVSRTGKRTRVILL